LIDAEVASGIPSERVVVAGFSQGGAVAMLMLRSKHKLAGVVGECVCVCVWGMNAVAAGSDHIIRHCMTQHDTA
jgi:alpha-beta hydrolase superfamily lysophospholipase